MTLTHGFVDSPVSLPDRAHGLEGSLFVRPVPRYATNRTYVDSPGVVPFDADADALVEKLVHHAAERWTHWQSEWPSSRAVQTWPSDCLEVRAHGTSQA
mmetsp:Transcript_75261/g.220652  ORF Transcript_75261/g.220652 Transcript_75261/m.220652 type:complete len:99 (+) Transcript_75261:115-411(+)